MKAIATKTFDGRRDEGTRVERFVPGDELTGDLARVAVENKWAKEESGKKASSSKAEK